MDAHRFDTIAKHFAGRRSRRQAMVQAGAGLAAGALTIAGLGRTTHAQDATPPAVAAGEKTMFLFVQSFQSGNVVPKEGAEGRYTLTLAQGLGQTVYFSDRPERLVGAAPTPRFLDGLGFADDNPPNAALVVEVADGRTEVAVVELFSPAYDAATHTATYEAAVLKEWEDALGVGLAETPADLAAFGDSFGAAHLFIDDCNDTLVACYDQNGNLVDFFQQVPTCWDTSASTCMPGYCNQTPQPACAAYDWWNARCNNAFSQCNGQCWNDDAIYGYRTACPRAHA